MTTTVTISGVVVSVLQGSVQISEPIDARATARFKCQDLTGVARYQLSQPVTITDSTGLIYAGFINDVGQSRYYPNVGMAYDISCIDNQYLATKRHYTGKEYTNRYSGDIAADILNNVLSSEGVTAAYAVRRDSTANQFNQGTISNVVGSTNIDDGDLELKSAGTTVTVIETTTSDFASGTLTNVTASSNALCLNSVQALQMTATSQQGSNNNYTYLKIWSGSYVIATGDQLVYTIWISSSSPKATGGLDLTFSDGTATRSLNVFDQNGLFANPATDLSGYGVDKWYTRSLGLSGDAGGKTLNYMTIAQEGDPSGTYTFYVRDAKILDSSNALKVQLMTNGTPSQTPTQLSDLGYSAVTLKTITAYIDSGVRVSPSRSISATGIVRSSLLNWNIALQDNLGNITSIAANAQGSNKINYCTMETSIDGGVTWQTITNNSAIPSLLAGANATFLSVLLRQTLKVAGPDPTIAPILLDTTITINPSYATTVNNYIKSVNSVNWSSSGTYSNTMTGYFGDLNLNGSYRNWATDPLPYANTTLLSSGLATSNVYQPNSCLQIRADGSTDIRARLDDVGSWADCTIECDVMLVDAVGNYGLCYRGAGNNTNNTYAYLAYIDSGSVALARGSNGGTPSYTVVTSVALTPVLGQWYHLKIQVTGTTHKIYVNDVLYITVTDSTYTAAGTIALRHYNSNAVGGSANRHSGFFQNFGVVYAQTGTWISTAVSLAGLTTFGNSVVLWNDTTPTNATLLIETSIDSGSTWQTATNGLAVPNATAGTSTSGKALSIRATLNSQNANATPALHGISVFFSSAYSSTGSRIAPALSLANVGILGTTSINWNATVPTNTTLAIASSLDGTTFTGVGSGANGNVAIPGLTTQPSPTIDDFIANTSANYTQSHESGGTAATWTWDTANSRLVAAGGVNDYQNMTTTATDVDIIVDTDYQDNGGLTWRWTNTSNHYYLSIYDSASSTPNKLVVSSVVAGVTTVLGTYSTLNFTRGLMSRFRVTMIGSAITVYQDGTSVMTLTNTNLTSGVVGLRNSNSGSGNTSRFYFLQVTTQGQNVVSTNVYTKATLTSTDPTVTPQLLDISTTAYSPNIINGALIPQTQYSLLSGASTSGVKIAAIFDDLVRQTAIDGYVAHWTIDKNRIFKFQSRTGTPAPWCLRDQDVYISGFNVDYADQNSLYRDSQWVTGGYDTISFTETKMGDNVSTSWALGYPIESITSISLNGVSASYGVATVDTGKQFYYTPGGTAIVLDASAYPLLNSQSFTISYYAKVQVVSNIKRNAAITSRASLESSSGLVEVVEDISQNPLNKQAMITLGNGLLSQYCLTGINISFTTTRAGLAPGQYLAAYLYSNAIAGSLFLITDKQTTYRAANVNGVMTQQAVYAIKATSGPVVGHWAKFFKK